MNEYNILIKEFLITHNILFKEEGEVLVIPHKNIAIHVLKLYQYSELAGKKRGYNLLNFNNFALRNIRLIQIFESEFISKPNIVFTRLKSYLGILPYNIFARKCEIREIPQDIKNKFLNKYHIQGQDYSSILALGIFYNNKLVSVASFAKKDEIWDLARFSGNSNFNICGGASKVLSHFEKIYHPKLLISFADKRWSSGNLYNKLGFKDTIHNPPSYWYFKQNTKCLYHKFRFRRNHLTRKLGYFDPNFSEWENMKNNGWDRIWDCGLIKFEKTY